MLIREENRISLKHGMEKWIKIIQATLAAEVYSSLIDDF